MADTTDPNDREKLLALARLVKRMRRKQTEYFQKRTPMVLGEARDLERHVDEAVADVLRTEEQGGLW